VDANEDVGVCVGEGDVRSEGLRREVYSATRVVISGAREVRSTIGGTIGEMERDVESEERESNRDVYADILEGRSVNVDVRSGGLWSDTRETRLGSRKVWSVRSWPAETRPGKGSFSGKGKDENCEP
jgi:hypothetical protein